MNPTVQTVSFKFAMPALALGAVLMLVGPTAALAQRGGGNRGGNSGGSSSGRSFSGGGRSYSAPSYSGRSYSGGGRSYAAPNSGRSYSGGRSYAAPYAGRSYSGGRSYYGGGYYRGGGGYNAGRFYAGRGYYYGGRFWARPYFGIGIGIPFGWGYASRLGCGYYDGYGYWQPAPCYPDVYSGY